MKYALILLALSVSGCASVEKTYEWQPGAGRTIADAKADRERCVGAGSTIDPGQTGDRRYKFIMRCMFESGNRLVEIGAQ